MSLVEGHVWSSLVNRLNFFLTRFIRPFARRSCSTFVMQGVNETFEVRKYNEVEGGEGEEVKGGGAAIVFIGGNLDKMELERGIRSCLL